MSTHISRCGTNQVVIDDEHDETVKVFMAIIAVGSAVQLPHRLVSLAVATSEPGCTVHPTSLTYVSW